MRRDRDTVDRMYMYMYVLDLTLEYVLKILYMFLSIHIFFFQNNYLDTENEHAVHICYNLLFYLSGFYELRIFESFVLCAYNGTFIMKIHDS